ncbi:MAG: hypothetical protein ACAH12_01635 [Methylophilaceae bacterium]|uniref:hypothetical protein n=1 Tax=Methylovorus sp. MM2 TaxID=1848038 RepID=UPI0007E28950|nr:hypothetical protein [Methylovorus sp. MM2]OAM51588.1 hypothetical protein A7981_08905 [Methylovorus sp. MM2]
MERRIKRKNMILLAMLITGVAGTAFESYQLWQIDKINQQLASGSLITDNHYPFEKKFMEAYQQANNQDFKHAVQSYGQLLELTTSNSHQAKIQFNIGNTLFSSGLNRRVNDDGTLKDEAKYDLSQSRIAYEQSLRLNPNNRPAKFNLSLLLSMLPKNISEFQKEQSGMELSNIPVGLP